MWDILVSAPKDQATKEIFSKIFLNLCTTISKRRQNPLREKESHISPSKSFIRCREVTTHGLQGRLSKEWNQTASQLEKKTLYFLTFLLFDFISPHLKPRYLCWKVNAYWSFQLFTSSFGELHTESWLTLNIEVMSQQLRLYACIKLTFGSEGFNHVHWSSMWSNSLLPAKQSGSVHFIRHSNTYFYISITKRSGWQQENRSVEVPSRLIRYLKGKLIGQWAIFSCLLFFLKLNPSPCWYNSPTPKRKSELQKSDHD